MKKILGIVGSPRKLGNCEIFIKEISRHISIPHELRLLRLSDFNILPCRGCYACLFKEKCIQDDDFQLVLNAVLESDALIVAAPTYFLGVNAGLKVLLDRGLAFSGHIEKLWRKPAVGIGIAGIQGKEGYTHLAIESFLKLLMAENKHCTICYGALPGEVFLDQQNIETAVNLAKALFSPPSNRSAFGCPLCGGDTFRFLGKDRVRCMLCSNPGTIDMQTGSPVFKVHKGGHELFLSKQEALQHREWLQRMKSRYLEQKTKLKEITKVYRKSGEWIKPGETKSEPLHET